MGKKVFAWKVDGDGGPTYWVVVAESLEEAHEQLVHEVRDYDQWRVDNYEPTEIHDSPFVVYMAEHYHD